MPVEGTQRTTGLYAAVPVDQHAVTGRFFWKQVATTALPLMQAPADSRELERAARVHTLRGSLAHLPTTSADLAREKAEEAEWEDRL